MRPDPPSNIKLSLIGALIGFGLIGPAILGWIVFIRLLFTGTPL